MKSAEDFTRAWDRATELLVLTEQFYADPSDENAAIIDTFMAYDREHAVEDWMEASAWMAHLLVQLKHVLVGRGIGDAGFDWGSWKGSWELP